MIRNIFFLILVISQFSCYAEKNIDEFYNYLGNKQSKVLQETIDYFNQFLNDNFKNEKNKEDKIYKFLEYFRDHEMHPNDNWIYDNDRCKLLIEKFEKSGLRKEFLIYGYEIYQIDSTLIKYYDNYRDSIWPMDTSKMIEQEEIVFDDLIKIRSDSMINTQRIKDSLKYINNKTTTPYSKIIVGIDKFKTGDTLIYNYTNSILIAGDITNGLLIDGLLNAEKKSYNDAFFDILIIKELFYGLMEYNCK